MALRNIRLRDRGLEPRGDAWKAAGADARRLYWRRLADYALGVKRDEVRRGIGADGKPLAAVKPSSRPDGATGKPLDPHHAESRTYRLLAAHVTAGGATLFWRGHGRVSWTTILGYHADGEVRGAPARDTIGLSPAGWRKVAAEGKELWKRQTKAASPNPNPGPKPLPEKPTPSRPAPEPPKVVHLRPGQAPNPRSKLIQISYEGAPRPERVKPVRVETVRARLAREQAEQQRKAAEEAARKKAEQDEAKKRDEAARRKADAGRLAADKGPKARADRAAGAGHRIEAEIRGEVSEKFAAEIRAAVDRFGDKVHEVLSKARSRVIGAGKFADVLPGIVNDHPRGWPEGWTWANSDGAGPTGNPFACEYYTSPYTGKPTRSTRYVGVLNHEVGHAFEDAAGRLRDHPDFVAAYDRDVRELPGDARAALSYYLQAGEAGRSEAFAETFAHLHGAGAAKHDMVTLFARCAAFIRGAIE